MSGTLALLLLLSAATSSQEAESDAGRLEAAYVRVIIHGSYATVIAQYNIDRTGAPLVFEAPRLSGQIVVVDRVFGPDGALEVRQLVDVRQITAPATTSGPAEFHLSYTVEEDYSQIPIFVPSVHSAPSTSPVRLEIIGAPSEARPEDAVPPFQRGPGGELTASPPELPSVMQLPPSPQGLSTAWSSVLTALLVICLAGLVWAGHRAWRKRNRTAGTV
jgi:hypothetical protein